MKGKEKTNFSGYELNCLKKWKSTAKIFGLFLVDTSFVNGLE